MRLFEVVSLFQGVLKDGSLSEGLAKFGQVAASLCGGAFWGLYQNQ